MSIEQYPPANGVLTSLIWRKTALGGETSLSGYDNASQALSYTPGQEQVYLNGILLVRGDDYTATNGTSITSLSELTAGDFVQINCYNNFSVASVPTSSLTGTITNAQLAGSIANDKLTNSSITINGSAVSLGGSTSITSLPSQTSNSGKYLSTDGSSASWSTIDLSSKLDISEPSVDYYVTNSGSGAYLVNGVSNGTIYFEKGKKYRIHVNAAGHPFWIQTVSGGYSSGNVYNTGITNNGTQNGHIIVELPQNAPQLYYACQYHSSMAGSIVTGITTAIPLQTGNSGKYLTTDGSTSSWAAASGGGLTLLSTTSLSGSSVTVSSISQSYKHLQIIIRDVYVSTSDDQFFRLNSDTGNNYSYRNQDISWTSNNSSGSFFSYIIEDTSKVPVLGKNTLTDVNKRGYAVIDIYRYTESEPKMINSWSYSSAGSTPTRLTRLYWTIYNSNTAISSFTYFPDTGSFSGGEIYIYGVS